MQAVANGDEKLAVAFRAGLEEYDESEPILSGKSCAMSRKQTKNFKEGISQIQEVEKACIANIQIPTEDDLLQRENHGSAVAAICSQNRTLTDGVVGFDTVHVGTNGADVA